MKYCRSIMSLLAFTFWALASDSYGVNLNKCTLSDGHVEFTDQPCSLDVPASPVQNKKPSNYSSSFPKNRIDISGLPAEDRLKSCDPTIAVAAAEEVVRNPDNLKEPVQLFSPAFTFFLNGRKDKAVFWFYAAQLRVRQQIVLDNGDRGQLLSIMLMTMGPSINNYAFQNISNFNKILDSVLEWDRKTENPFREKASSQKLDKKIDQVYIGFSELKAKLATEKVSLESAARQAAPGLEQSYAQMNGQRCRKGETDPAYENQMIKEEERLALDFITHNNQVIKLAGGSVNALPSSSTSYKNDRNKARYEFSIMGAKEFEAIVDVFRNSGKPEFTLACLTTLSMGERDPYKDVCTQSSIRLPK